MNQGSNRFRKVERKSQQKFLPGREVPFPDFCETKTTERRPKGLKFYEIYITDLI